MNKQFYFLVGLPRSGSSLLGAILNQHPQIFVTPTSPMLDILIEVQNAWSKLPSAIANPSAIQLTNIVKSIIQASWQHIPKPIIIDKNRGWGKNIEASTILFGEEIKVLLTTRDLPSIMTSWLTLLYNNPNNGVDINIRNKGFAITDENRTAELWFNMMEDCMYTSMQAKLDAKNRLHIVHYDDLISKTQEILFNIETFLNVDHHSYDLINIQSNNMNNDLSAWLIDGMHTVRTSINKISKNPIDILGLELYNRFIELESRFN